MKIRIGRTRWIVKLGRYRMGCRREDGRWIIALPFLFAHGITRWKHD